MGDAKEQGAGKLGDPVEFTAYWAILPGPRDRSDDIAVAIRSVLDSLASDRPAPSMSWAERRIREQVLRRAIAILEEAEQNNSASTDNEHLLSELKQEYRRFLAFADQAVSVYISADEPSAVLAALAELGAEYGFVPTPDGDVERGSWFRRFRVRFNEGGPSKLADLATKLERAAELHGIHQVRSQNDEREANAVASLITALDTTEEAVIRLSSIIVVKADSRVISHVLTEQQIEHLDRNPDLLKNPRAILDALRQGVWVAVESGGSGQGQSGLGGHQPPLALDD
ncbi:MAG: hypothetical protein HOV94_06605 [Saccharothrix sp.]|nr:hypothetical protein [Saccharothrix sp.]